MAVANEAGRWAITAVRVKAGEEMVRTDGMGRSRLGSGRAGGEDPSRRRGEVRMRECVVVCLVDGWTEAVALLEVCRKIEGCAEVAGFRIADTERCEDVPPSIPLLDVRCVDLAVIVVDFPFVLTPLFAVEPALSAFFAVRSAGTSSLVELAATSPPYPFPPSPSRSFLLALTEWFIGAIVVS